MMIDPVNNGGINRVKRCCANNHPFGTGMNMLGCGFTRTEQAGTFQHHINI